VSFRETRVVNVVLTPPLQVKRKIMSLGLRAKANVFWGYGLAAVFLVLTQSLAAQNLTFEDIKKLPVPAGAQRSSYGSDPSQFGELRLPPAALRRKASMTLPRPTLNAGASSRNRTS